MATGPAENLITHGSLEEVLTQGLYEQIRESAVRIMRMEGRQVTLGPTVLVHEAFLRLRAYVPPNEWPDRRGWLRIANLAMRHFLIDYARRRARGAAHAGLDELTQEVEQATGGLLRFDELTEALLQFDAEAAEVLRARYYQGLSVEQIADALGLSPRTVKRIIRRGLMFLKGRIGREES